MKKEGVVGGDNNNSGRDDMVQQGGYFSFSVISIGWR